MTNAQLISYCVYCEALRFHGHVCPNRERLASPFSLLGILALASPSARSATERPPPPAPGHQLRSLS